jgi:hypothetical protein
MLFGALLNQVVQNPTMLVTEALASEGCGASYKDAGIKPTATSPL